MCEFCPSVKEATCSVCGRSHLQAALDGAKFIDKEADPIDDVIILMNFLKYDTILADRMKQLLDGDTLLERIQANIETYNTVVIL